MAKNRKFRVYVEFTTRLSTDVFAESAESAYESIDKFEFSKALDKLGGRRWQSWELHGGVKKVCEVLKRTEEYEKKATLNKEDSCKKNGDQ